MKNLIKHQLKKSKISLTTLAFAIITMFSIGCGPTPTPLACNTSNTLFQQIYNSTVSSTGFSNVVTYDSEIHEYSFTLSGNKTVCSVGYQSQPEIARVSTPYTIELRDSTTQTTVFTLSNTFDSLATSYVSVASTPTLIAGHTYTVKRILTNYQYINYCIGRMVNISGTPSTALFPRTSGNMTIIGSRFYQAAGLVVDYGIPFIDIVFQ